jgi:2-dehydro-3-deoxygluconokinase
MHGNAMKVITFGEVMMRLSAPRHQRIGQVRSFESTFGGSEANVAASLTAFGVRTEHVTRFPENELGIAATAYLRSLGVGTSYIIHGPQRMGLYFLETGAMQRSSKIIYDRFDSAFSAISSNMIGWDEVFKEANWFHWTGITPAISAGAAVVCLDALYAAKEKGLTVSGDINYRRNLWQYGKKALEVMPEFVSLTDHVVAGVADIENCTGISGEDLASSAANLFSAFPNVVSVSSTNRTSLSASHNQIDAEMHVRGHKYQSSSYELNPIVDRIGTGDAFMAGLINGWIHKWEPAVTLEFATAACAWKHSVEGDVNIASVREIESLMKKENIGKLLR